MNKSLIIIIIFFLAFSLCYPMKTSLAQDGLPLLNHDSPDVTSDFQKMADYRAEKGLRNLEPYSLMLIEKGLQSFREQKGKETTVLLEKAGEFSPDLPLPYVYLTRVHFSFSSDGLSASGYLVEAWYAFINNFRWSFQTAGMLSISLFFAFYLSVIIFLVTVMSTKLLLYVHDVAENKRILFLLLPAAVFVLMGPVPGLIGFLLPFWRYVRGKERVLATGSIIIVLMLFLAEPMVALFIHGLQDKTLHSIVKINEGRYTGDALEIPKSEESFEAVFSAALNLKRNGYYHEAIALYQKLLEEKKDPKVYNNLADAYLVAGNNDMAMMFYDKALQEKKLASTYFNLSQITREKFDFNNAKKYYLTAMEIDSGKVAFYDSVKGITANRFVMDEAFDTRELWLTAFQRPQHGKSIRVILSSVNTTLSMLIIFFLTILLFASDTYIPAGAYRCKRCGDIHCSKCEKKLFHDSVCHACHKTLVKLGELTPQERVEKILEIQRYKNSRYRNVKLLTLMFPGVGHIYYGWTGQGFMRIILFSFFLFSTAFWIFIPTPLSMNALSSVITWIAAAGLIIVYVSTVMNIFRRVP